MTSTTEPKGIPCSDRVREIQAERGIERPPWRREKTPAKRRGRIVLRRYAPKEGQR